MKNFLVGAGLVSLGLIAAVAIEAAGDAEAAQRTKSVTYDDAAFLRESHGDYVKLGDGGTRWTACFVATSIDGGSIFVERPCVTCEGSTTTNCQRNWADANGF